MASYLVRYSDEAVVAGWGTAIEGATTHFLGLCFLSTGHYSQALECLRDAIEVNSECNWPLLRARSELLFALALYLSPARQDYSEAARYALRANETYRKSRIDIARNPFLLPAHHSGALRTLIPTHSPSCAPTYADSGRSAKVTAHDEGELVAFKLGQHSVQLKRTKATMQLAWLVRSPGTDIPASILAQIDGPARLRRDHSPVQIGTRPAKMQTIDDQARAEYSRRVREIRRSLEAPSDDPAYHVELKEELEWLTNTLEQSRGIGGKTRMVSDVDERARISVRNNLANAITRIRRHSDRIGVHLANAVRTGAVCCYRPE